MTADVSCLHAKVTNLIPRSRESGGSRVVEVNRIHSPLVSLQSPAVSAVPDVPHYSLCT